MSGKTDYGITAPVQSPSNTDIGVIPNELPTPVSSSAAKRKYEQVLQLLDDVTGVHLAPDGPPAPKRAKTNIYATLARYGIGTSTNNRPSGTPLARVIQRTKTCPPSHEDDNTDLPNALIKDYDPDSCIGFLTRLQTYKLMTYCSKPPEIDSVAASRCGWRNEGGKETLNCRTCGVSWVMPVNDSDKGSRVKVQAEALVERHQTSCPWKLRQCESSIYSMPISSPSTLSTVVYRRAERIAAVSCGMEIKYPLTADQCQVILSAAISAQAAILRSFQLAERGAEPPSGQTVAVSSAPPETSCILAFFGWDVAPPSTISLSTSLPTVVNDCQVSPPLHGLLMCTLCQRQVATRNFLSSCPPCQSLGSSGTRRHQARTFDVLREHRTHCPYIIKATLSPSLAPISMPWAREGEPDTQNTALNPSIELLEGWKIHLNTLLRSERRRMPEYASLGGMQGKTVEGSRENPVGEIIETVRTQHGGGRELLRFVKGLLG